jgi:predicted MFS family arabinose efflux permease
MLGALGTGAWMDGNPRSYRIIYPLAGLLGAISAYLYYRIRQRRFAVASRLERAARHGGRAPRADLAAAAGDWLGDVQRALRNPLKGSVSTFRADPNFLRFEVAFMIYGIAWMMMQPVIPLFLVDVIKIQYAQAGVARGLVFWGAMALSSPVFGRLLDRWNAVRLAAVAFVILSVFPLTLAFSHSVHTVYAAFLVFGVGMSAGSIAWTMGPILFARDRDAATYMGVHVTMVGIRGLVGNPVGLTLLQTIGARATFVVSSILFLVGAYYMARLAPRVDAQSA